MRSSRRPLNPRKKVWADLLSNSPISLTAGTLNVYDLLQTYRSAGGNTQGVTVIRTLINIFWVPTTTAFNFTEQFAAGLGVSQIGVATADFDPTVKPYLDWMLNDYRANLSPVAAASTYQPSAASVFQTGSMQWDVRSRRKMEEIGDTLNFVIKQVAAVSGGVSYRLHARTLLLLP